MKNKVEYRKPTNTFIAQEDAPKLYKLEEKRNNILQEEAEQLLKDMELTDLYREALPQVFFNILQSFDTTASILAATAYLESQGKTVT